MSLDPSGSHPLRGFLVSTAVVALVAGVGALGLVHHLARTVAAPGSRYAALPPGVVDPEVTGAIGSAARSIVLDPCNGRERLIVRGP